MSVRLQKGAVFIGNPLQCEGCITDDGTENSMRLNADIVLDNLPSNLNAHMTGPKTMDLMLGRPQLYAGGSEPFEQNVLYLVNAERIPGRATVGRGCVIVCIGETPQLERYRSRCCVITVRQDADFYRTFNTLQDIFDRYDAWEDELRGIVEGHGSVDQLLTCSEAVFGNPLYAIDGDFKMLGVSRSVTTIESHTAIAPADGELLNIGAFDQFLGQHDLSMDEREPLVLTILDQTTLSYNLFKADEYQGCLVLHYVDRLYRQSDKPLIAFLGSFLLASMQQLAAQSPEGPGSLRQAVQALVEERPLDSIERDIIDAASNGQRIVCMRMKLSNQLEQLPLGYVRNTVERSFSRCTVFEYHHNSIVAIIDIDAIGGNGYRQAIAKGVEPFIGSMEMNAGVSAPYVSLLDARSLFLQADRALDMGLLFDAGQRIYFYEDYALRGLVMNAVSDMRLELLFPEGLRRLVEHDRASSTSYVDTLRTYLDNNASVAKTASALYVHRSTLMERLTRIKRDLGMNLDDPDEQLHLRLLLKAMQTRDELREEQGRNMP